MSPEADQLLDEIRQIMQQYKAEFPVDNRSWPKSIQDRVVKLFPQMDPIEIAVRTEISRSTIYYWHRRMRGVLKPRRSKSVREASFLPLKISSMAESNSTVETKSTIATATILGPNGLLIKDVTPEFAAQLLKLLGEDNGNQI